MLQLPAELIMPNYGTSGRFGTTIANIPATVAALLDVSLEGSLPPLPEALWRPLGKASRIVVLIIDALGQNLLDHERERLLGVLEQTALQETITSIFPSTTVNCLSSMWTGYAPAQHGLVGLNLYFPDLGAVGQMIQFTPRFGRYPDALITAGVQPENFLPVPAIAEQLGHSGINTYAFKGRDIVNSALSKVHGRGVTGNHGAVTFADLLSQMRQLLETKLEEKMYVCGYWPTIDTLSHYYTAYGDATIHELRALFKQIETVFLKELSAAARKDTLFFIVADHGQIADSGQAIEVNNLPELKNLLLIKGAGEPRVPYLYAKQGQVGTLLTYLQTNFPEEIAPYPSSWLVEQGLFGPSPYADALPERLGDVTGIMKKGALFLTDEKDKKLYTWFKSGHGGLTEDEMIVPWLAFAL